MSSVFIAWCYFWTDTLHWLQTTAHFCATLSYNRKRKKTSINFLHIRILVFRSAPQVFVSGALEEPATTAGCPTPVDTSAVLSSLDVRTCLSVKGNKSSMDWRYSVVKITWMHVAKTRETYCMGLGIGLPLSRQPKREMLMPLVWYNRYAPRLFDAVRMRTSLRYLGSFVSVSSVYYDAVFRTVISVTDPCWHLTSLLVNNRRYVRRIQRFRLTTWWSARRKLGSVCKHIAHFIVYHFRCVCGRL